MTNTESNSTTSRIIPLAVKGLPVFLGLIILLAAYNTFNPTWRMSAAESIIYEREEAQKQRILESNQRHSTYLYEAVLTSQGTRRLDALNELFKPCYSCYRVTGRYSSYWPDVKTMGTTWRELRQLRYNAAAAVASNALHSIRQQSAPRASWEKPPLTPELDVNHIYRMIERYDLQLEDIGTTKSEMRQLLGL